MTNLAMSNTAEGHIAVLNSGSKCSLTSESTPLPRQEREGGGIAAGYPPASPLRGNSPCAVSLDRHLPQQDKEVVDRITLFLICALLFLLTACGSPPTRPPPLIAQLQTTEKSAHQALRDGDLLRARDLFAQTLRLQQSLDDLNGIARSSLNLATLLHTLGDDTAALQLLESLLKNNAPYSAENRSTAAFRKAVIVLDAYADSPTAPALSLADQTLSAALKICADHCAELIGIKNLQARLTLLKGDHLTALNIAESVLENSAATPEEQANAARIAGLAQNNLSQYEQALAHYVNALQIDKTLGLSSRIILDLQGIANALQKLGRTPEAEDYARRATAALIAEQALRPAPPTKPTGNNP